MFIYFVSSTSKNIVEPLWREPLTYFVPLTYFFTVLTSIQPYGQFNPMVFIWKYNINPWFCMRVISLCYNYIWALRIRLSFFQTRNSDLRLLGVIMNKKVIDRIERKSAGRILSFKRQKPSTITTNCIASKIKILSVIGSGN